MRLGGSQSGSKRTFREGFDALNVVVGTRFRAHQPHTHIAVPRERGMSVTARRNRYVTESGPKWCVLPY